MYDKENIFENVCEKGVKITAILIIGFLTYWSSISTFRLTFNYLETENIWEYKDYTIKNLLVAFTGILLLWVFQKLILRRNEEQNKRKVFFLALSVVLFIGIFLIIWVTQNPIEPYWDQLHVYQAAEQFRQGDFSLMQTEYFGMYTQQYGIIFFEEFLIGFWKDYRLFQYINVLLICMIIFLLYQITDLLFNEQTVNLYCLAGIFAFIPLYIYVTYIYGDIASIALNLLTTWGVLKWEKQGGKRFVIISVISSVISYLLRNNTLIFLIATAIVCLVLTIRKRNWRPLIFALALLMAPQAAKWGIELFYEHRSGIEIGNGMPAEAWIAMGMQGEEGGAGIWNGFGDALWYQTEGDSASVKEASLDYIHERIQEFQQDLTYAWEFYRYKILEQWSEPSYTSFTLTGKKTDKMGNSGKIVYFGLVPDYICRFMNYYQFLIFFGALCYAVWGLWHKEEIHKLLLLITMIGGFLFSILWEAKGRYVLPYVIFLIPYMAKGIYIIQGAAARSKKFILARQSIHKNADP